MQGRIGKEASNLGNYKEGSSLLESKDEGSFHLQERKLEALGYRARKYSGNKGNRWLQVWERGDRMLPLRGEEIEKLPILGTGREGGIIRYGRRKTKQTRKDS